MMDKGAPSVYHSDMDNVTIKDIALAAGVSSSTVSRVLSGHASISEETRKRVLALCDSMNYTTNYLARAMAVRRTHVLGLILPALDDPFMSELAYHIEKRATEFGYRILLSNSLGDANTEHRSFDLLAGMQADGMLVFPVDESSRVRLEKLLPKTPTVFISDYVEDMSLSFVTTDNYRGAKMALDYLLSLGHRRILYFAPDSARVSHVHRRRGYFDACAEAGIEPMTYDFPSQPITLELGYRRALELFKERPLDYTAIFTCSDILAMGILQAADECGIPIPDSLSLLGFDNIRYAALPRIGLSTIAQPLADIGTLAVDLLLSSIDNPAAGSTHKFLQPSLIPRSSCKRVENQ